MKKLIVVILAVLFISGCTNYTRRLDVYVEDGGTLTIGNVRVTAEVKKGDENMKNSPTMPDISIPLPGGGFGL